MEFAYMHGNTSDYVSIISLYICKNRIKLSEQVETDADLIQAAWTLEHTSISRTNELEKIT